MLELNNTCCLGFFISATFIIALFNHNSMCNFQRGPIKMVLLKFSVDQQYDSSVPCIYSNIHFVFSTSVNAFLSVFFGHEGQYSMQNSYNMFILHYPQTAPALRTVVH